MRITKYIHACLLIENEADKILFILNSSSQTRQQGDFK